MLQNLGQRETIGGFQYEDASKQVLERLTKPHVVPLRLKIKITIKNIRVCPEWELTAGEHEECDAK